MVDPLAARVHSNSLARLGMKISYRIAVGNAPSRATTGSSIVSLATRNAPTCSAAVWSTSGRSGSTQSSRRTAFDRSRVIDVEAAGDADLERFGTEGEAAEPIVHSGNARDIAFADSDVRIRAALPHRSSGCDPATYVRTPRARPAWRNLFASRR
ncbi:hypothetical protein [Streptomyces sp. NPDC001978]|uniref:hypothetical protein n=1 Tax=Streptomyces sp. NPDC001978 TaxID=3364627 RepID=UPI00367ADB7C